MGYKPYFYTMPNGIRIVTQQVDNETHIYSNVYIGVGNKDFPERYSGLPHLVEHLAFSGTATRSERDINDIRKRMQGWLGASTSHDWTLYYGGAFAGEGLDKFELLADLISDMISNSIIPEERLAHEKNVVINEMRQRADDPSMRIRDYQNISIFPGHSKGRAIVGSEEDVLSFTRADCLSVFDHYSADKIVITAVGPASAEGMASVIMEKFSGLQRKPHPVHTLPTKLKSGLCDMGSTDFLNQNHFIATVPVNIGFGSDHYWVVDMIGDMLNERLNDSRNSHDFTYGIGARYEMEEDKSYIQISGCTHPNTSDRFLSEIAGQIKSLKAGFTEEEITRKQEESIIFFSNIHNNTKMLNHFLQAEMVERGRVFDQEAHVKLLKFLSPDAVNELAQASMSDEVSLAYLGRTANFMGFDMFRELCGKAQTPQFSAKKTFESPRLDISS